MPRLHFSVLIGPRGRVLWETVRIERPRDAKKTDRLKGNRRSNYISTKKRLFDVD
jgi:hypothetical protein